MDFTQLNASNGLGEAVRATVTQTRNAGSTVLNVDSIVNWPTKFIATTGKLLSSNTLDPTTINVFSGTLNGTQITVGAFAPGYTDKGNNVGDVVVIKPTTWWADTVAAAASQMNTFTQTNGDWRTLSVVPTVTSNNGQREHVLTYAATDYTGTLQPGMRLKIPRTSTVPTKSGSFVAANSQYASLASPTGFSSMTQITLEAWVYVNSYGGANSSIVTKRDNINGQGNGFRLSLTSSGQLDIGGFNANNYRGTGSYQAVPLGKWVHVAASIDMGAGTYASYIDGVSVPNVPYTSGTPATSIAQAGALQIGAENSTNFANMQIANVRIWSTIRTAQQIRDNANKSLVGNETGLVGAWQLNGDFSDKTANANTLTANGGAIATYADNPWKANEFAIVTAVSKPANDTVVTVFTGPNAIPNETLGTTSYSVARAPFGFPTGKGLWSVRTLWNNYQSITFGATNADTESQFMLTIPTGVWDYRAEYFVEQVNSTSASASITTYGKLKSTSQRVSGLTTRTYSGVSVGYWPLQCYRTTSLTLTSADTLFHGALTGGGGGAVSYNIGPGAMGANGQDMLVAECAYI